MYLFMPQCACATSQGKTTKKTKQEFSEVVLTLPLFKTCTGLWVFFEAICSVEIASDISTWPGNFHVYEIHLLQEREAQQNVRERYRLTVPKVKSTSFYSFCSIFTAFSYLHIYFWIARNLFSFRWRFEQFISSFNWFECVSRINFMSSTLIAREEEKLFGSYETKTQLRMSLIWGNITLYLVLKRNLLLILEEEKKETGFWLEFYDGESWLCADLCFDFY